MGFDFKSKRPHGAWRCSARMGHGGRMCRIYAPYVSYASAPAPGPRCRSAPQG